MDHYEMVEKLREKANVSYDEAKRALEAVSYTHLIWAISRRRLW